MLLLVDHQSSLFHTATSPLRRRFAARLPGFVALMKPRVMSLAVFTAFVGLTIAPGHLDPLLGSLAIVAIAAGAGAAGALNMWYEADIDALMARTARRPIPRGGISRAEALVFGLILACSAVAILALVFNIKAAALLVFAIFFYVVVYTMWLKSDATEHCHRRRGRRTSARNWLDRRNRRNRARAGRLVPYHLSVDAAPFLGAVAQSCRRICSRWRPYVAGGCRGDCNNAADPDLLRSSASNFAVAVRLRVWQPALWNGRG